MSHSLNHIASIAFANSKVIYLSFNRLSTQNYDAYLLLGFCLMFRKLFFDTNNDLKNNFAKE